MAWTCKIKSKSVASGVATIAVEFADGNESFMKVYKTGVAYPADFFPKQVALEIDRMTALAAYVDSLELAEVKPMDLTSETEKAVAASDFSKARMRLASLQKAAASDLIPASDPRIAALEQEIKAKFLDEYLSDLR